MPPNQATNGRGYAVITSLRDLQRKYLRDKDVIRSTWLSLSPEQRKEVIIAGAAGGESGFLRHRDDPSLGRTRHIIPELNLRDLIPGEALLDFLDVRATTPIRDMYPTDAHFMRTSMQVNNFSHSTGRKSGAVIMFTEEESWGNGFELTIGAPPDTLNNLIQMGKGCVLNENEGFMILERQSYIYSFLSIVVDDILDMKRLIEDPDAKKRLPKRARPHIQKLSSAPESSRANKSKQKDRPSEPTKEPTRAPSREKQLSRLAVDARAALLSAEDHISLLREEPLYLSHTASHFFFSTPGIVPDGSGITELINTAAVATTAVLDLLKDAYTAHTHWHYTSILTSSNPTLTTEIWATCNKELLRARSVFRRFVATEPKYTKFFVRTTPTDPATNALPELAFKAPLETIPKKAQFTSWILSLADTTPLAYTDTAKLLHEMDDFVERVPAARENISERMGGALADIAVITMFMQRLQAVLGVPEGESNFVNRMEKRVGELREIWKGVDLAEWAWPIDNLKGKEAMVGCLEAAEAGLDGGLEGVFGGVVEECVEELRQKAEVEEPKPDETEAPPKTPMPMEPPGPTEPIPIPTTHKKKEPIVPPSSTTPPKAATITAPPSTLKTFRKIFRPDSASGGGGIPWSVFTSAMTSIGFSVESIGGSVTRFRPPKDGEKGWQPVNLHRPHPTDRFEGWALLKLKKRLTRCYGWSVDTFVMGRK